MSMSQIIFFIIILAHIIQIVFYVYYKLDLKNLNAYDLYVNIALPLLSVILNFAKAQQEHENNIGQANVQQEQENNNGQANDQQEQGNNDAQPNLQQEQENNVAQPNLQQEQENNDAQPNHLQVQENNNAQPNPQHEQENNGNSDDTKILIKYINK